MQIEILDGFHYPQGASFIDNGINFAVFAPNAEKINICVFVENVEILTIILPKKTNGIFHGLVKGIEIKKYGIRAFGKYDPQNGYYYNANKLLIDPFSLELDGPIILNESQFSGEFNSSQYLLDSAQHVPKTIITKPQIANPQLKIPLKDTIIYEVHIKGFSQNNPNINPEIRGKFNALADDIAIKYFKELGINCLEIMPCAAWVDETHLKKLGLTNYWGYNPICHMVPDKKYAPNGWKDILTTTKKLEDNGIETIIDVVFNHSGEGDKNGPILSYRGLDNLNYYRIQNNEYENSSGCGNVFACDRPQNISLFIETLRAWRKFGGVHGFRFDLASILGNDANGFNPNCALFTAILNDKELSQLKLIVEPWDCKQYNIGEFPFEFAEWNDKFRDNIRKFWRGDNLIGDFAKSFSASEDIFANKSPSKSINYIVSHDGFSLFDLVSYENKNNFANGENNQDGNNNNLSWNNGFEGIIDDENINSKRIKDVKILLSSLLLSRGTPMLSMGSEIGKTQFGNNNAYAQDNEISYLDWNNFNNEIFDFTKNLIKIRKEFLNFNNDEFFNGQTNNLWPDIMWLDENCEIIKQNIWENKNQNFLNIAIENNQKRILIIINRSNEKIDFKLPIANDNHFWKKILDCDNKENQEIMHAQASFINSRNLQIIIEEKSITPIEYSISEDTLNKICNVLGISQSWHDVNGNETFVPFETIKTITNALGYDINSEQKGRQSLNEIINKYDLRPLPFHKSFDFSKIKLIEFYGKNPLPEHLIIEDKMGAKKHIKTHNLATKKIKLENGIYRNFYIFELSDLNIGHYKLYFENDEANYCSITIAPDTCFFPQEFNDLKLSGISAQIYSLKRQNDQGIGDFSTINSLLKIAQNNGLNILAINPLHALFQNSRDLKSPYYPSNRCFLEPLYIDLGVKISDDDALINYEKIWQIKREFLYKEYLQNKNDLEFLKYKKQNKNIENHAIFEAISNKLNTKSWHDWPNDLKSKQGAAISKFANENQDEIDFQKYLQFKCETQLNSLEFGKMKIGLCRDLAIGSAPNGGEAWVNSEIIIHNISIGAPPDPMGPNGQIWGLPPYNPLKIKENHFDFYYNLFTANMKKAGALRIDHAMGLMRQFWVPNKMEGQNGTYIDFPFKDLMAELKLASHENECLIIAEDLGTLPYGFSDIMNEAKALSYKVLPFEKEENEFKKPFQYPFKSFACVSTHDLPPINGWWQAIDLKEKLEIGILNNEEFNLEKSKRNFEIKQIIETLQTSGYLDKNIDLNEINCPFELKIAMHEYIASSNAFLAIAQFEDILGANIPINIPGTDKERPNWSHKLNLTIEDFECNIDNNTNIFKAITKNRIIS